MRLFLWDQMERFDLVPACQIPSRSTVSPIHMHTASKQPGTMQNTPKVGGRGRKKETVCERVCDFGHACVVMHVRKRGRMEEVCQCKILKTKALLKSQNKVMTCSATKHIHVELYQQSVDRRRETSFIHTGLSVGTSQINIVADGVLITFICAFTHKRNRKTSILGMILSELSLISFTFAKGVLHFALQIKGSCDSSVSAFLLYCMLPPVLICRL